ncbi:hypothetical protein [uncultured Fibrobacter sp.]|uniref:hypothetical protein n=1 Tax=uncultured Fibrobacter sp. TaxID=261512 RepID=UPI002605FC27|nr:hypothetical protein [uncultured Fibrobacter sp.]
MISKKVLFPLAAVAMASFVACGDDSSSGSPASGNTAPASVPTFMDIDSYECSATVNKCAKVLIEDKNDTMQCDGVNAWRSLVTGPIAACEATSQPAEETPADPATENPTDPAVETPADPATETPADPVVETPADPTATNSGELPESVKSYAELEAYTCSETVHKCATVPLVDAFGTDIYQCDGSRWFMQVSGDIIGCEKNTDTAPVTGDKAYCSKDGSCVEGPASSAAECKAEEGETLVESCPAGGYACEIPEQEIIMYFYDEASAEESCAFIKAIMAL